MKINNYKKSLPICRFAAKNLMPVFIVLISYVGLNAENNEIVKWDYQINIEQGNQSEITIKADIDNDWYIYGMNIQGQGPLPLNFIIENEKVAVLQDFKELEEPGKLFDEVFNMDVTYYENTTKFKALIKTDINQFRLTIDGQACYKIDGTCLQVYKEIIVKLD